VVIRRYSSNWVPVYPAYIANDRDPVGVTVLEIEGSERSGECEDGVSRKLTGNC
jgi:hypothetical protein